MQGVVGYVALRLHRCGRRAWVCISQIMRLYLLSIFQFSVEPYQVCQYQVLQYLRLFGQLGLLHLVHPEVG